MDSEGGTSRLDAFVDAAFAFAVTLLLIQVGSVPRDYAELRAAMAEVPAFAFGFAVIAMFWCAHVRWRRLASASGPPALLLSLLLVFLVLVYVYPLRLMSGSFVGYLSGAGTAPLREVLGLFLIYGAGFAAMSLTLAALFAGSALKRAAGPVRAHLLGEAGIWLICAGAGLASILFGQFRATFMLSLWSYAVMSAAIGLFAWAWDWDGARSRRG